MKAIDVFYQGETLASIHHVQADADETLEALKQRIARTHDMTAAELELFVEDEDEPRAPDVAVGKVAEPRGLKVHVHRCRRVHVVVRFNGRAVKRDFSPAATVNRVKNWAAVREFGMSADVASEHVLQLAGNQERPAPGTHLGTLVTKQCCEVAFDLVPDERINGAAEGR